MKWTGNKITPFDINHEASTPTRHKKKGGLDLRWRRKSTCWRCNSFPPVICSEEWHAVTVRTPSGLRVSEGC